MQDRIPFRFARVSRPKLCTTCKLCTKDVRYMMTQQPPTPSLDFWTAHLSGRCPHSGSSMFCTMLIVSCQNDRSVRAQQRALEISIGVAHSVKGRRRKRCAQQDPPSTWVDVQYVARAKVWMGRAASPQTISIPLIKVAMGGTDLQRFSRVLGICLQVSKSALQLGNLRFLRDFFYHRSCGRHAGGCVYTCGARGVDFFPRGREREENKRNETQMKRFRLLCASARARASVIQEDLHSPASALRASDSHCLHLDAVRRH